MDAPVLDLYREQKTYEVEQGFTYAKFESKPISHPHLQLETGNDEQVLIEKINQYYDLDEVVKFLQQQEDGLPKYRRITLQFPDNLICDSATIVHQLQARLGISTASAVTNLDHCGTKVNSCHNNGNHCSNNGCSSASLIEDNTRQTIWILADTSFSSCCIDEVAAEHVNSDLVIHFGDACLNEVDKLPAAYVLGKPNLDKLDIIDQFKQRFTHDDKVLLMASAPNTYVLQDIYTELSHLDYNVAYADLHIQSSNATILGYTPNQNCTSHHLLNRSLINLQIQDDNIDDSLSSYELFHIGIPDTPRLLQLTTRFSGVTLYDPLTKTIDQGPFPNLMRRYRYMQVARTSGTIGLLVNTLSLNNTKKLMKLISKKIKDAGKKHYLFVVGKPNVAKLANFENIDIWCILGCDHQGIIVDQYNEYFKPIITPYELLLALNDELTWTGKWVTDFNQVLLDMNQEQDSKSPIESNNDYPSSDEEPEFDPVTGKYISTSRPLRQLNHLQITTENDNDSTQKSNSLVKKFSTTVAIKNTVSTSATHLQSRTWTGLGSDYNLDDNEGSLVEEGISGVARGYNFDVKNNQK